MRSIEEIEKALAEVNIYGTKNDKTIYFKIYRGESLAGGYFTPCKEYILDETQLFVKGGGEIKDTVLITKLSAPEIHFDKIKSVIRQVEDFLGWPHSHIYISKQYLILIGDKNWSLCPPVLSLYASLVRISLYVETNDFVNRIGSLKGLVFNDQMTVEHEGLKPFLSELKNHSEYLSLDVKKNWTSDTAYSNIHALGIYNFLNYIESLSSKPKNYYINYKKDFVVMLKKNFDKARI